MSDVRPIGIDETSVKHGQHCITAAHDLDARRLLFATAGRDHSTVVDFTADLQAHGGDIAQVEHVCMDMSTAFAKRVHSALPDAAVSYDHFHVVAMAQETMDEVRHAEMREHRQAVRKAVGANNPKVLSNLLWGICKNPANWNQKQLNTMRWLQR